MKDDGYETPNKVRIIGGKWRGRVLHFQAHLQLRPTTNFIRETLFNWLAPHITDKICLDMFAGSGALGFEALSRGAKQVVMMDESPQVIADLKENAKKIATNDIELVCNKFSANLVNPFQQQFDLVFVDPPYGKNLVKECCYWLEANNCLAEHAFIYIERERTLLNLDVPENWQLHRQKATGNVSYSLFAR